MAVIAYIGLGSNLGDREENLRRALEMMDGLPGTRVLRVSSLYRTEPVGVTDQPEFLNLAVELETELEPKALLISLQKIEDDLGRVRQVRWGSRTIDLDIIYYGDRIVEEPKLEVPHPRANQRAFVLEPLAEIAPDLVDPVTGRSVKEMLEELDRKGQRVEKAGSIVRSTIIGEQSLP